jgi:hypothetical protein
MKVCEICKGVGWIEADKVKLDGSYKQTINYDVFKPCSCQKEETKEPATQIAPKPKGNPFWWND